MLYLTTFDLADKHSDPAQFPLCSRFLSDEDKGGVGGVLFLFCLLVLCKCCPAPETLLLLFLFSLVLEGTPYLRILMCECPSSFCFLFTALGNFLFSGSSSFQKDGIKVVSVCQMFAMFQTLCLVLCMN